MSDSATVWNLLNDVSDGYARGYRAGQAAAEARIKELEAGLRRLRLSHLTALSELYGGYEELKRDDALKALLKEADQ